VYLIFVDVIVYLNDFKIFNLKDCTENCKIFLHVIYDTLKQMKSFFLHIIFYIIIYCYVYKCGYIDLTQLLCQ